MPRRFTFESTGPITNMLRNSDKPASTWFGGTDCNPSAFLVSDRTMKILVKLVTSSSKDGAIARTVMASSTVTDELGLLPPTWTDTVSLPTAGAVGPAGAVGVAGAVGAADAELASKDAPTANPNSSTAISATLRIADMSASVRPGGEIA